MNANIQFGRGIKPVEIKDVQKAGVSILFDKMSQRQFSANITVGAEPWVIKAFGLKDGESIVVYNVFGGERTPLYFKDELIELTSTNNTVILGLTGVYRLELNFVLGDLVCITYPISAMEEKAKRSAAISNPNGPQKQRPNKVLDGTEYSTDIYVGSTPTVIRAYGLIGQTIELLSFFGEEEEQVTEEDIPVELTAINSTLIVNIAGGYRLRVVGDPTGIEAVINPTTLNYTEPFMKRGLTGPAGPPGASGSGYIHTQSTPSDEWTINHNLGFKPSVELLTVGGAEFEADVIHTSINQTVVYIVQPMAGTARLN